ncbi:MAG: DNA translocase FtsK 4TM domain-containing protein [Muribaculaceae bacterium]|nr:DNA translocase FtsK 4TM domain-containing protein [Muribaculaceae bacterium]
MDRYDNYNPEIPYTDSYSLPDEKPEVPAARTTTKDKKSSQSRRSQKPAAQTRQKAKQPKAASEPFVDQVKNWATSFTTRCITGLILAGLGAWMLIAFISYLNDCFPDQSVINNTPIGQAKGVANSAGEGGARLMEFLINDCFGLGSVVIIIWMFAMSLKLLLGAPKFKSVNFTIKCIVALITVSLIVGLMTIASSSTVNWGGYHGRYVNQFVIDFVGWSGDIILCAVMIFIFVVICMSDFIRWIGRIKARNAERRRRIAEENARKLEEQRIIEEMRSQEYADDVSAGLVAAGDETEGATETTVSFNPDEANGYYSEMADVDDYEMTDPLDRRVDSDSEVADSNSPEDDDNSDAHESCLSNDHDEDEVQYVAATQFSSDTESYGLEDSSENDGLSSSETPEYSSDALDTGESMDSEDVDDSEADDTYVDDDDMSADDAPAADGIDGPMVVNVNEVAQAEVSRDQRSQMYKFPPLEILREGDTNISVNDEEQMENKEKIRQTLADFGIPIVSIEATVGPTVTLYEIRPDKGQKVANIKKLVDDISLSLAAIGVRIIAPIPGKGTVGIEVANKAPQMVSMRTVIGSRKYAESRYKLPVALGCTINNDVYIADLTRMPHMLVAGATGQGKSVGLNVIIASLLYRKKPHELKFVMIDPKMVEFSLYSKIEKHYLAKLPGEEKAIITDMGKAVATLNSLVQEMEDRYKLLMDAGCRKVEEYNAKFHAGQLPANAGHRFMPYIVVIIDEFCDLIMSQGKEVEKPIARLAQKARAVGIHEIIATQRPSTTVITGNIKANFLTRVAFKVSSGIDSKTILDTTGAQQLIGRGDMLINFNSEMTRVQCAFMDTPEVEELTEYISRQPYGSGPYILPEPLMPVDAEGGGSDMDSTIGSDPRFLEVATHVVQTGYASTSNIQRKFSLGYNRAGKIMDQLEQLGVVSAAQGGKPRTVLMQLSEAMEVIHNAAGQ